MLEPEEQWANGGASGSHGPDHSINVVIRVRPLITGQSDSAKAARDAAISRDGDATRGDPPTAITFPAAGQIQVHDTIASTDRFFAFNVVFEPEARQEDVFEHSGVKRLIDMALDGFACTVFAYGQTSTGKTYTLTGNVFQTEQERLALASQSSSSRRSQASKSRDKSSDSSRSAASSSPKNIGIVQLSFAYLFEQIKRRKLRDRTLYVITVSYLEVYNEQVLDLLNPSPRCLNVRWAKDRGFYAENLFKVECEDIGDLEGVLEEGCKNRQVRSHSMNENSSRSHAVMTITLSSEQPDPEDPQGFIRKEGRFCLVDLAGSEKTKRTNSQGSTFVEANNINRSLLVLGNCIACLADPKRRNGHIPYRDSTLTKLLADSLSGNGMTLMVACVSPLKVDSQETINTLRYASRAKRVRMNPVVQMDPRELLILSLKREVRSLRMENNYLRQNFHQILANSQQSEENSAIGGVDRNAIMAILNNSNEAEPTRAIGDKDGQSSKLMRENEVLRVENVQLNLQRNRLIRDHELVCRENEKLTKKLEAFFAKGDSKALRSRQTPLTAVQLLPSLSSSASSPSLLSLVSEEELKSMRVNNGVMGLPGGQSAAPNGSGTGRHYSSRSAPAEESEPEEAEDSNDLLLITQSRQTNEKHDQAWSRSTANGSSHNSRGSRHLEESKSIHMIATQPEPGTAGMLDLTIRGKSAVNIANRVQGNGRRRI